ncbi:MAG: hypothetical protein LUH22_19650 [Bacteroides sp.]|nr:hypothetical protein [Bacteroides sp.]
MEHLQWIAQSEPCCFFIECSDEILVDIGDGKSEVHLDQANIYAVTQDYRENLGTEYNVKILGSKDALISLIIGYDSNAPVTLKGEVDFSKNNQLEEIHTIGRVTNLKLNNCPQLKTIHHRGIFQSKKDIRIDIDPSDNIETFYIEHIAGFICPNFDKIPNVKDLSLSETDMTEIDTSTFPLVETLFFAGNNKLEFIGFSNNPEVKQISCEGCLFSDDPEKLVHIVNSLPNRTGKSVGRLSGIGNNMHPFIQEVCNEKNWTLL